MSLLCNFERFNMRLPIRLLLALLVVPVASVASLADTVLFDDHIDAQQKTELRYDVPDGCVITGLGFRAAYDNITTMHCRYHRLAPDGTLTDPAEVHLGSEPNHACEAKVLLPDGWVAVGFGAAGEPEWDVTMLRIWARPLRPDGTLGPIKAYSDGFKPDRGPERQITLTKADRVLIGAGLRFHQNNIAGVYARSKRILNLTDQARKRISAFKTRAWVVSGLLYTGLSRLTDDLKAHSITRMDIVNPRKPLAFPSADNLESNVWLDTINFAKIQEVLADTPDFTGIVLDLARLPLQDQTPNALLNLHKSCKTENLRMSLRLDHHSNPLSVKNIQLVRAMPKDVALIVPLYEPRFFKQSDSPLDFAPFGPRDVIVELDLIRRSMGSSRIPDVRIDEIPGLITEAALAGAKGFIVQVNLINRELLDGINSLSLQALHRLADDPLQPTDVLWNEFCTAKFGPTARQAAASLKRTAAINDLIYRTFDYPLLWYNGTMHPLLEIDDRIKHFARISSSPDTNLVLRELLEPTDKTIDSAGREKQTALWLLQQSIRDANEALKVNPTPETRALSKAMNNLNSVALFWYNATRAYVLTKLYAIDGATVTCANITEALKALDETGDSMTINDGLGILRVGRTAFARTLRGSLEYSQKNALLPQALINVRKLAATGRDVLAANALLQILSSDRLKPHLSKQNQAIGEIASSLRAFGGLSPNLAVMRHGDGSWLIEKVAGRWSYVIGPDRPCLYLDFVSGPLERPADYVLSFEYFDQGDWKLHFHYDSDYPPDQKRQYHPVEPLQLTNTKTWKQGSFLLTNCLFSSGQNDLADMRFVTGSGARIRNIRLKPK
jgi:hypothetical protein